MRTSIAACVGLCISSFSAHARPAPGDLSHPDGGEQPAETADAHVDWQAIPLDTEGRSLGRLQNIFTTASAVQKNEKVDRCMMVWHAPRSLEPPVVEARFELHLQTDQNGFDVSRAVLRHINIGDKRSEDRKLRSCLAFAFMGPVRVAGVEPGQRFRVLFPATLHRFPMSYYREKYLNHASPHHPRNWQIGGKPVGEQTATAPAPRP